MFRKPRGPVESAMTRFPSRESVHVYLDSIVDDYPSFAQ